MNRLKLLISSLFAVALACGIIVGLAIASYRANGMLNIGQRSHERGSWLAEQLSLTPTQNEQMKEIWSSMVQPGPSYERRRPLQKERDDAIFALLTEEQKAEHAKIIDKYNQQLAELDRERERAFQAAVERTREILTDSQREKYDELLKKGPPSGRSPGGWDRSERRGPRRSSTSQPATAPAI